MNLALIIIHIVISLLLVVVVLMQHGKQQGMSGAIAGGAETFFGKNKGRTIDAMLKKFTGVLAVLFVASSVVLTVVSVNDYKAENAEQTGVIDDAGIEVNTDAEGNVVDVTEDVQTDGAAETETAENADAE